MNKNRKFHHFFILLYFLSSLLCIGSCSNNLYFGKGLFAEGPTKEVNDEKWGKLKIGMSKAEVANLLGDSPSKHTVSVGSHEKNDNTFEYWEYGYRSSLIGGPSPKAYVVFFNKEGFVTRFRKPKEK